MKWVKWFVAAACLVAAGAQAETCLNTEKGKYDSSDPRSSDYVKCKPTAPVGSTGAAGAVGGVGGVLKGMAERQQAEEAAEDARRDQEREARRPGADAWDRARFKTLKAYTAEEVNIMYSPELRRSYGRYAPAQVSAAEAASVQSALADIAKQGKLMATLEAGAYDQPWSPSASALDNHRRCATGTTLAAALVYGQGLGTEARNPKRGFAVAKAGCAAHCGGTCLWLGRIYEDGDGAAPGVDDDLGHDAQHKTLAAYDQAILNGEPEALAREAWINFKTPPRWVDKTYFVWAELESYDYWYENEDHHRLAYAQFKRCLELMPTHLSCAQGVNAVIRDAKDEHPYWKSLARDIADDGKVEAFAQLEAKLKAQGAGTR